VTGGSFDSGAHHGGQPDDVRTVLADRAIALTALFDSDRPPNEPHALPVPWHWAALSRWEWSSNVRPDGHASSDPTVPPTRYTRRMWAGGEISVHRPLTPGERVRIELVGAATSHKNGRSGPFDLVVQRFVIRNQADQVCLEERRDLIFRPSVDARQPSATASATAATSSRASAPPPACGSVPPSPQTQAPTRLLQRRGPWRWDFRADAAALMRYSAATANTHRIHYDLRYATAVEGYPDLVVHGPLMTTALCEVIRNETGAEPTWLRHRNVAPLYSGELATTVLRGRAASPQAVDLVSEGVVRTSIEFEVDR
jgi:3-methylfumaryl-CoA hydratase